MIKRILALGAMVIVIYGTIISVAVGVFAFWTQSNISFYVAYFTEKPYEADYWASFMVSFVAMFIAGAMLWANAILSVLRLFL